MFTFDNPHGYERQQCWRNVQLNYEKMRTITLDRYDKVWCVESDIIPPADALEKLLEVDAPVVSGLYALRHGTPIPSVKVWGETLHGIGSAMRWEEIAANWGKTVQTSGACMGCTLIDRSAFEGFSFLLRDSVPPDGAWMEHCFHNAIKQMARLDVLCGHKRPDGEIWWPQDSVKQTIKSKGIHA